MFLNNKEWTGDRNSIYKTLGASNHTQDEREKNDYYATDPAAVKKLLQKEVFNKNIWEPACGAGHISKVLQEGGYDVKSTDLVYRGYGEEKTIDFLKTNITFNGDIITNPPYKMATEFVEKAINVIPDGNKVAMFLKIQFLESKKRRVLFEKYPPQTVYVFSERINCAKNGIFKKGDAKAVCYCWFIWVKGFKGNPQIKWI